jgi:hypothetical protein
LGISWSEKESRKHKQNGKGRSAQISLTFHSEVV